MLQQLNNCNLRTLGDTPLPSLGVAESEAYDDHQS